MAFTEAQQQIIDKVINSSMKDDFVEDRETIAKNFDPNITDEQKDAEKFKLAEEYLQLDQEEKAEEADALVSTASATTRVETDNLQSSLGDSKEKIGDLQSESVFEILCDGNSNMLDDMAKQLNVDMNTEEGKKTVEDFSGKIQNMRGLYIKGTVPEGFPVAIQENISVALSFSLMKWLSTQDAGLTKKMNESASGIDKEKGLNANISGLFGFLRKTTEFLPMMTKISRIASLIDFHQSELFTPDTDGKMNCEKLDCFNSPSACYQWMEQNNMILADKIPVESTSYESVFDQSYTLNNDVLVSIANKVNYDESTHKFMRDTVIPKGTAILEMRNNAQENLNPIYEQLSMIANMFGSSVSDMVGEGTIGKVLNFVSLLVCGCSLKGLDKKHFMAEDWKNFPQNSKPGLSEAVAYASKFMDEYDPKEHGLSGSLLDKNLLQQFESADYSKYEVNDTISTAAMILPIIPTSFDALDDGLCHAMESEKGFIPSATILESIGLAGYYITDENGNSIFDATKKADLMTKLNTDANREALISMARQNTLTPDIIAGVAKNGGNREDVIALMYGSLLTSPDIMTKALEHDILDGVQLTHGIVISGMVNKGVDGKKGQEGVVEEKGLGTTDALVAGAGVVASSNIYTEDMKTSVEGLDSSKKLGELTFTEAKTFAYAIFGSGPATELLIKLSNGKPTLITRLIALGNHEGGLIFDRRNDDPNTSSRQTNIGTFQISDTKDNIVSVYNKALETGKSILTNQGIEYKSDYFKNISSYDSSPLKTSQEKAQHDVLTWLGHMKNCGRWESVLKLLTMEGQDLARLISQKLQVGVADIGRSVLSQLSQQPLSVYLDKTEALRSSSVTHLEKNSETQKTSLDLAEKSINTSETVLFGASNAGTIAGVLDDTTQWKGVHSFSGKNSATLKTEAEKITDWGKRSIITSTVNNGYNTDEKAQQAVNDIQAIAQKAILAGSIPLIVLYPDPTNWSDKTVNPNRYKKFQYYNELMRTWCQDQIGDIKPKVLDLTTSPNKEKFKRDESGYHVDSKAMNDIITPYLLG